MKIIDHDLLQQMISRTLTLDELGAVCNRLGINIEKVPGRGLFAKAHGIVSFVADSGRTAELLDTLRGLHPSTFSEYYLDEPKLSLIEVPADQIEERVVRLKVSDPQAETLMNQIETLQDRIAVLVDPIIQQRAYDNLEEASRLLRADPAKVEDWPLQMNRAQFLYHKTSAIAYRAEKLQEQKKAEIESVIEQEKRRAVDEQKLTWLVPLVTLGYVVLVIVLLVVALIFAGEEFTIPILGLPLPVIVWSAVGSISALLYRYYKRKKTAALVSEIRLLIGRFWIGVVAGCIFYFAIRSGLFLLSNQGADLNKAPLGLQQAVWVLVWLVAFSDYVFERVIARIAGDVIGEETERSVSSVLQVTASEVASMIDRASNEQLAELRRLRAELDQVKTNSGSFMRPEQPESPAEDRSPVDASTSQEPASTK